MNEDRHPDDNASHLPLVGPVARRRGIALIVAIALSVVAVSAVAAAIIRTTPSDIGAVQAVVDSVVRSESCATAAEASTALRRGLDGASLADWAVSPSRHIAPDDCVAAVVLPESRTVFVIRALGAEVSTAMETVGDELLDRCLDENEARSFLRSQLKALGLGDAEIRTDGPLAYPSDKRAAVEKHLAAGCFIYTGSGTDASSGQVFYLGGLANSD